MESTNELVTAAEARAEGLSLDWIANNRCITKQQFNDNLPEGGDLSAQIDMLNGSLDSKTILLFNNTTNDTSIEVMTMDMYNNQQTHSVDIPASSMKVYPLTGALRVISLRGASLVGSNSIASTIIAGVNKVVLYTDYSSERLDVGASTSQPLSNCLIVICINN